MVEKTKLTELAKLLEKHEFGGILFLKGQQSVFIIYFGRTERFRTLFFKINGNNEQ